MAETSESRFERAYCDCAVQHEAERESSQNRNNPRQRRQEEDGANLSRLVVQRYSLIGQTVALRPRGISARWDNLLLGHFMHIELYLGFRLAGTFFVKNVPAKLHPRLSDTIATRLFCNGLLYVGRICWVQSRPKSRRTSFWHCAVTFAHWTNRHIAASAHIRSLG